MANRQAKIKSIQVNDLRRQRNRSYRTMLSTQLRKLEDTIKGGDKSAAQTELKESFRQVDKTASRGIIHNNKAARTKSRLYARVAKMA
jgi:small subunit ribosomal protein S20